MNNNPDFSKQNAPLTLRIIGADGKDTVCSCDFVKLYCKNGKKGTDGGSVGIKKGHMKTVISLANQSVTAFLKGEIVYNSDILSGVVKVENNKVTVLKD